MVDLDPQDSSGYDVILLVKLTLSVCYTKMMLATMLT
jgi:hypothetical protein